MSTSDTIALAAAFFAAVSTGGALWSLILSKRALIEAGLSRAMNKDMFKRQGVIDLHMAWQGVNEIDPATLVGPDVCLAANALSLTATLWNHDVVERIILFQSYWKSYKALYDSLSCDVLVPGYTTKKCRDFLTPEMLRAYEEMKDFAMERVEQTKVGGLP